MKYCHAFQVRAPQAAVSAFYSRSASLAAITPPLVPMRVHRAPERLVAGDELEFTMWLGPVPVRWLARVDEASAAGFVDRQVQGPFASWAHRHRFVAVAESTTEVVDEVEARLRRHVFWLPIGLILWLGLPLLFAFRAWRTRRLLERTGP